MLGFFARWLSNAVAVFAAAHLVNGIHYRSFGSLLVAALALGVANALLRPVLVLVSLPVMLLTFGLFSLVINTFLLWLVGQVVRGFAVEGWWAAFWGSLVISLVSLFMRSFQSRSGVRMQARSSPQASKPSSSPPGGPGGNGRVIDV